MSPSVRQTLLPADGCLVIELAGEVGGHVEQYYQRGEDKEQQKQLVHGLHRAPFQTRSLIANLDTVDARPRQWPSSILFGYFIDENLASVAERGTLRCRVLDLGYGNERERVCKVATT